jgi:hypothetical protein
MKKALVKHSIFNVCHPPLRVSVLVVFFFHFSKVMPDDGFFFKDRMTVHRDKFIVNETNRRTEFQFYWYYDSTRFGQPFCPSSGVLSRTSALVHCMQIL